MELKDIPVGEWFARENPGWCKDGFMFIKDNKNQIWAYEDPYFSENGHRPMEQVNELNYDNYNNIFKTWVIVEP